MFCGNCGNEVAPNNKFCAKCGAVVEYSLQNEGYDPDADYYMEESYLKGSKNKKVIVISVIAAVLLIGMAALVIMLSSSSPEDVACEFVMASFEGDFDKMSDLLPVDIEVVIEDRLLRNEALLGTSRGDIFKQAREKYGYPIYSVEDLAKYNKIAQNKLNLEKYGQYTLETEVVSTTQINEQMLDELMEDNKKDIERYDIDKFTDGMKVEVVLTVNGERASDVIFRDYTVVKSGGDWVIFGS